MLRAIPYRYRVLVLLCSLTTLAYLDRICARRLRENKI